jgi:hypothetical protein
MSLGVSNLGQLGMGRGSLIDAGGGWHLASGGANILYEGALMITSAGGHLSDAARRADGTSPFDFNPLDSITLTTHPDGVSDASTSFDDRYAGYPVGVSVTQTVTMFSGSADTRLALLEWTLSNRSAVPIDSLQCGLLLDIDLPLPGAMNEYACQDSASNGFYHAASGTGIVAGIVPLNAPFATLRFCQNTPGGKRMFTQSEKSALLYPGGNSPDGLQGDLFEIAAGTPVTLAPSGEIVFAVALILADSPQQFVQAAGDARRRWQEYTSINEGEGGAAMLPGAQLNQNFPNPFNPSTVISYSLKRDGRVRLDVFNLLGQHVRTVSDGWNSAGTNSVIWDGTDSRGQSVASGIYMYRLETTQGSITRKMALIR